MDRTDDITRGGGLLPNVICIWYEGNINTYHKTNSGGTDRNRGQLST